MRFTTMAILLSVAVLSRGREFLRLDMFAPILGRTPTRTRPTSAGEACLRMPLGEDIGVSEPPKRALGARQSAHARTRCGERTHPDELRVPRSVRLGQLRLDAVDLRGAADWILDRAAKKRPCLVITSNINHLRLAEDDSRFRDVAERSELNVADGWPLVLATHLLGEPLPPRVAGVDLVDTVLSSAERLRVAVLGGPPGAAERFAERFGDRHDMVLCDPLRKGTWNQPKERESLRSAVAAAQPNLILIGLGPPRQEMLADDLRRSVAGPIIGCGATIEFLAGMRRRAPRWLQRLRLEWAFRLAIEPRRLGGRYLRSGARFLVTLLREMRRRRVRTAATLSTDYYRS
ncbi:MAG: WecB/TagA/CpsF family glycosyltransferase [Actinomycetota bacterium]